MIYIPKTDKQLIMFYLNKLSYVRTYVVNQKSGFRNLKNQDQDKDEQIIDHKFSKKIKKKIRSIQASEEDSSENSDKNKNILTKEKILELQVHNFIEIRNFIFSLPIYGSDVALERFRPNGDKYSASKITEPLIKIQLSSFCKRIDEKTHSIKSPKKLKKININQNNNIIESPRSTNTDNYLFSSNNSSSTETTKQISSIHGDEVNKGLASDSSIAFSNYFKDNIIKYISFLINFAFLGTFILILIEFLITYNHIKKIKIKIDFMTSSYVILNNILYIKHFITEGVLINTLNDSYPPVKLQGGYSACMKNIENELISNRQQFTELYDTFSSNQVCKEYKDFISSTKIQLYTLTIDIPQKLSLLFNNAMTRISSSVNNLISNPSLMVMSNRDTYELMYNLINDYFSNWYKVVKILVEDSKKSTQLLIPLMIIVFGYFIISIIIIIVFLNFLAKFSLVREKPINLFLTIKKIVFENLKNSAENFSNKLLNKFFGNEDIEQESQKEYQTNIKQNDINIAKFKAANEFNSSSFKKAFDSIKIIIIIIIFLFLNLIYFIIKYFDFKNKMGNIEQFIVLFDNINLAHSDIIMSVNIFKSFLYNKSIPIMNENNTLFEFLETFLTPTERFEQSIIYITKTKSFLSGQYLRKYEQYYLGDFTELLEPNFMKEYGESIGNNNKYGVKPIETWIIEIIRYYTIKYCISQEIYDKNDNISEILKEEDYKIMEMNFVQESIIRKWYIGIIKLMIESFYDYQSKSNVKYIIFFICLLVIIILYYCFIWRINEEKLIILLKGSADLINLIPLEIKGIIIEKLNE